MSAEAMSNLFERAAHNPSFASVSREYGLEAKPLDFCVPVNRHFPPASLVEEIQEALPDILKYYPDYARVHQDCLSRLIDVPSESIVVGNGSTELITLLCQQAETQAPMASCIPTFGQWTDLPRRSGTPMHYLRRHAANGHAPSPDSIIDFVRSRRIRTLVLCNPNNPTGATLTLSQIMQVVYELQDLSRIIIDESFIDYATVDSAQSLVSLAPNLVVVKSLGKSLGWHGVRLGYAVAQETLAESLRQRLPSWNINALAAFVLQRVTERREELQRSFVLTRQDRDLFARQLGSLDAVTVYPSQANFLFLKLDSRFDGRWLRNRLLERHGCFIRECSNKVGSSEQYLRLAVNLPDENRRLVEAMRALLTEQNSQAATTS